MLEFQQFNAMWDRKAKEYEERAGELLEAMRQRHQVSAVARAWSAAGARERRAQTRRVSRGRAQETTEHRPVRRRHRRGEHRGAGRSACAARVWTREGARRVERGD